MNNVTAKPESDDRSPTIAGVKVEDIGVLPQVVAQITELAEQPSTRAEEVSELILQDPALTSKILKVINSAYYGLRQEIRSLSHAVGYLGVHQIRNLVISSSLVESFRFDHGVVEPRELWEHSLGCAMAAKRIGDRLPGVDGDGIYLGGLLHDLGRIILLSKFPEGYAAVVGVCERGLCTLREAEESQFEISHEEAGSLLGAAWGFSKPVLAAILYHHRPGDAGPLAEQVAVVTIANCMCHRYGMRFGFAVDDDTVAEEEKQARAILVTSNPALGEEKWRALEEAAVESIRHTRTVVDQLF